MGTDGDTAEIVTYVNDAGRKIIIMHMNGAPVSQVPEGFYPEGTEPSEETTEVTPEQPPAAPQVQPQRGVREDDPSDPPEKRGGGVIHTGGYVDSQQVESSALQLGTLVTTLMAALLLTTPNMVKLR